MKLSCSHLATHKRMHSHTLTTLSLSLAHTHTHTRARHNCSDVMQRIAEKRDIFLEKFARKSLAEATYAMKKEYVEEA